MKTRNGIHYDLKHSTYTFKVPDTKVTYVFSSDLHLVKFEEQYLDNRHEVNLKLKVRFKIEVATTNLADIILYKRIETRGFLVYSEGGNILCLENLLLSGERVTRKS